MVRDSFGEQGTLNTRVEPTATSNSYIHETQLPDAIINEVVYTSQGGEVIKVASRPYIAHIGRVM